MPPSRRRKQLRNVFSCTVIQIGGLSLEKKFFVLVRELSTTPTRIALITWSCTKLKSHWIYSNFLLPAFSDKISQTTVLRIEPIWENNSAPALIKTKDHHVEVRHEHPSRNEETKTLSSTNKVNSKDFKLFHLYKIKRKKTFHFFRFIHKHPILPSRKPPIFNKRKV